MGCRGFTPGLNALVSPWTPHRLWPDVQTAWRVLCGPSFPRGGRLCPWGRERLPSPLPPQTRELRGALCYISTFSVFW